jgi:hypothetical protein
MRTHSFSIARSMQEKLFGASSCHVPVLLARLTQARALWVNRRLMAIDPAFTDLGGSVVAYTKHLLDSCAYIVANESPARNGGLREPGSAVGYADRYGGCGIGHNGGSGRNVYVNGYMVKGVGRTPLVSVLTPSSHASGGAYLEECVRETVYGEVASREFPYGGVSTLAIIDTGLTQTWQPGISPSRERRTLLVRLPFLRPAHFERAVGFISSNHKEGALDHQRVVAMFRVAADEFGKQELAKQFSAFWLKWAEQLAYGFVHRLPHGNNTSSNIALDGRLADFGAMSSVPSWSVTATSFYPDPFLHRIDSVVQAMRSVGYYCGRHLDPSIGERANIDQHAQRCVNAFQRRVLFEALRLCGVSDDVASDVLASKTAETAWKIVRDLIAHFQAEQIDLIETVEMPRLLWDLATVWQQKPAQHLRRLRSLLNDIVARAEQARAAERCGHRSASRPLLYKPQLRARFFRALDIGGSEELCMQPDALAKWIDQTVDASRRDKEPSAPIHETARKKVGADA